MKLVRSQRNSVSSVNERKATIEEATTAEESSTRGSTLKGIFELLKRVFFLKKQKGFYHKRESCYFICVRFFSCYKQHLSLYFSKCVSHKYYNPRSNQCNIFFLMLIIVS